MTQVTEPTQWSASSLDTILTCAKQYEFSKTNAPKVITSNPRQNLGSAFHDAVAAYYTKFQNKLKDKDQISVEFSLLFKAECSKYHLPKLETRKDRCIAQFVDFEIDRVKNTDNSKKPVFVELNVKNDKYRGYIDFYNNGQIIDWKTGKFEKFDRKMMIQGKIYEILGNDNEYPVKNTIFYVVGDEKPRKLPLPYFDTKELEKYVNQANEIIKTGKFEYINEKNKHLCSYCDFNLICTFQRRGITLWSNFI